MWNNDIHNDTPGRVHYVNNTLYTILHYYTNICILLINRSSLLNWNNYCTQSHTTSSQTKKTKLQSKRADSFANYTIEMTHKNTVRPLLRSTGRCDHVMTNTRSCRHCGLTSPKFFHKYSQISSKIITLKVTECYYLKRTAQRNITNSK